MGTKRKSTTNVRRLTAVGLLALAVPLAACEPAPPPPQPTCDPITEAQNNAVTNGMTLAQVQAAIGNKRLVLESRMEFSDGEVWEMYGYEQTWDANNCSQFVLYDFENGRLTDKFWSAVVK